MDLPLEGVDSMCIVFNVLIGIAALGIMFSLGIFAIAGTVARQVTNAIAITRTSDFTW